MTSPKKTAMTDEAKTQLTIDFWKMLQVASPLVAMIGFIVYMQADLGATVEDVASLKRHGENVGQILTAHSTQIAVNSSQIQYNKINDEKLAATLQRLENKIDALLTQRD